MGRHGENIHKRKDGRWEARLITGHSNNGKALYRYIYGKTYLDAKRKRNAILANQHRLAHDRHDRNFSGILFQQLAEQWLLHKRSMVKESTYAHYANLLEKQLLPELGNVFLQNITSEQVEQVLRRKLQSGRLDKSGGLSRKTASDLRALLNQILQYGRVHGFPQLESIQIPSISYDLPTIQTFSRSEQRALESVLLSQQMPLYLGILTALYTGLRIGEVCALQWRDISLKTGMIYVKKTMIRIRNLEENSQTKTKILIERPKTQCSIRMIPLPDFLVYILADNRKEEDCYLLTGTTHFMEPRSCLAQYKKILRESELSDHSFHALRHTFATRCVEEGFDVKSLSEIMGHSSVSITMQRYVHPSLEQKREQMNKLAPLSIHGQTEGQTLCRNT